MLGRTRRNMHFHQLERGRSLPMPKAIRTMLMISVSVVGNLVTCRWHVIRSLYASSTRALAILLISALLRKGLTKLLDTLAVVPQVLVFITMRSLRLLLVP